MFRTLALGVLVAAATGCSPGSGPADRPTPEAPMVQKDPYKDRLTAEQYYVLRQKGTERAFTGRYNDHFEVGIYSCGACGADLFVSDAKYDSGCGWPAFSDAIPGAVRLVPDGGAQEVICETCQSHLGHLFKNEPSPTGQRY